MSRVYYPSVYSDNLVTRVTWLVLNFSPVYLLLASIQRNG